MGARPCAAQLANLLSGGTLHRICVDRRRELVHRDARTISARCAGNTNTIASANIDSHTHTASHVDTTANTHAASDRNTQHYVNTARYVDAIHHANCQLHPTDCYS